MKNNIPPSILIKRIPKYIGIAVVATFLMFFALGEWMRISDLNQKKLEARVNEQIAVINNTHLTMSDVMGTNLPPDPGAEADKTVAGVDANNNGIRDDVELAIFKEYPNSAKTRAALLQYALALQMEVTQPFDETGNATAIATAEGRANLCLVMVISGEEKERKIYLEKMDYSSNFLKSLQLNTKARIVADENYAEKIRSYGVDSLGACDIGLEKLTN